jgi:hypothetical protein
MLETGQDRTAALLETGAESMISTMLGWRS